MSFNSSSPSKSSLNSTVYTCSRSTVSVLISTASSITRTIFILPLSILIIFLAHQRWRQQHSSTTTSHSDIITCHMAAMELIWVFGTALIMWGIFADHPQMEMVVTSLYSISFCGLNFLHFLICVERYLAVVHPITYLGLRKERGVRIRNISIGCVWLQSVVCMTMTIPKDPTLSNIILFCPVVFTLVVLSFCSISVLCVLIRPGPGQRGRDKQRGGRSKQKAFLIVMVMLGALWLWLGGILVSFSLNVSGLLSPSVSCVVNAFVFWFNLPSSLMVPLLYLHRAGKLVSFCCNKSR